MLRFIASSTGSTQSTICNAGNRSKVDHIHAIYTISLSSPTSTITFKYYMYVSKQFILADLTQTYNDLSEENYSQHG